MTIKGMVADHPWQLSPGLNFAIKSVFQIPSLKYTSFLGMVGDHPWQCCDLSVVNFLLVDYGEGCYLLLLVETGVKEINVSFFYHGLFKENQIKLC